MEIAYGLSDLNIKSFRLVIRYNAYHQGKCKLDREIFVFRTLLRSVRTVVYDLEPVIFNSHIALRPPPSQ